MWYTVVQILPIVVNYTEYGFLFVIYLLVIDFAQLNFYID